MTPDNSGLLLFAYDGSDLAGSAIAEAGRQLATARDAVVLTAWEPFKVEFIPLQGTQFNAMNSYDVGAAANKVAGYGATLARAAGFQAQSMAIRATPSWRAIVDVAEARGASLIVLGSHGRTSLASVPVGSVAVAVTRHSTCSVLIVHRPGGPGHTCSIRSGETEVHASADFVDKR